MATRNFYVKNANDVYAFAMEAEDCFDYDDSLDRIKEAGVSKYGFEETSGDDGDRNFCGFYILDKDFGCRDFYNSDLSVAINITIMVRGGYYQGANLDFELEVMNDDYYPYKLGDYESEDDLLTLSHTIKNRRTLAQGAVIAAEFLCGRKGVYTMDDLIG